MSQVKLDPEKKFKWPEYKNAAPLTESENTQLKQVLQETYTELIDVTLNSLGLPPCSGEIKLITTVVGKSTTYIDQPLFGTYKMTDINKKLNESTLSEDIKDQIELLYTSNINRIGLPTDINNIKKKFRECALNNLFIIHMSAIPIRNIPPNETYTSHANILVIAKNRGIVYWIEPQTTVNPKYEELMIKSIKDLVAEIGMPGATVINPVEVCPQAVTQDRNCMFWSYVIFLLIMLNPQERDHNVLIKNFMEKYPTKELLEGYINGLKRFLFSMAFRSGSGRRRRTYRKKRRTTRRR